MKKTVIIILLVLVVGVCYATLGDFEVIGDLKLTGDEKKLYFYEGVNYLTFRAPGTLAGNYNFTWPINDGDSGQVLITNGSGVFVFSDVNGGGGGDMFLAVYDVDEDGDIDVAGGGTGLQSLTDHCLLIGSGTSPVTMLGVATNGQLPIGSTGADPVLATLTATASETTITNAAGAITVGLPDDIAVVDANFTGTIKIATGGGLFFGTTQWDDGSDEIDGEIIADDTIDDDSIDFTDITATDFSDFGTMTATSGNILVADGTDFETCTMSSDATIASGGALTIANNAVALATDTTGNYVATIADSGGSTITVANSGSENAAVTLRVDNVTDADFTDITVSSGNWTLDANTVAASEIANADYGDFTFSYGVATLDYNTVSGDELASADFGDFTVAYGSVTLDYNTVSSDELADGDYGEITVAYGVVTLDANVSGFATTALDNLASVAINTSLISDTGNTDDLGSSSKRWRNLWLDGTAYTYEIDAEYVYGDSAEFRNNDEGHQLSLAYWGSAIAYFGVNTDGDLTIALASGDEILPASDDSYNLGSSSLEWKDLYIDGTAYVDALDGATLANCTIDISDNTDLAAGTNITLADDTLNVDDAFLINSGNDTMMGDLAVNDVNVSGCAVLGSLIVDTDTLIVDAVNDRVGIGTSSPDSVFHIKANIAGSVGSHSAGQIIIQNPTDSVFSNVVITGYESDGNGDPDQQLWYLGSSSSGNTDIIFLNRRNAKLALGTSGTSRLTILGNGNVGINVTDPDAKLEVVGTLHVSDAATFDGTLTGGELQVDDINIDGTTITGGSGEDSFHLVHSAGGSIQFDNNVDGLEATFTGTGVFGHTAAIGGGIVEAIAGGSEDPHTPVYVDNYCNNIARNSALYFRKSLSDTIGTKTDTSAGTDIGSIFFFGVDNTQAFDHGARIFVEQEGAIGTRVPTRFQFQTSTSTTPFITGIKIDPAGEVFMPQVYNDDVGAISGTDRDLLIDPNGQLGYDSSSARYKENIRDLTGSERIYDLRPRLYNRIGLEEDEAGLIAEEVELTMPEVVSYKTEIIRTYLPTYDPNDPTTADHFTERVVTTNQPETVVKSKLIVPILKELQKLKAENDALKERVTELEKK